ncbi:hypothetical protein ABZX93_35150 [Streptomyces sp. NPDC006632]|uniref:hypothetical protein n=1 Tax=Streptomyces sp. NPDC006632 TaxID=3157182 RepID=UPI0033B7F5F2
MGFTPEVRRGGGLPFGQFVSRWCCDPRYSTNLRTLYTILITYADVGARDTSRGKPWRTELAAQLGVSVKTLDRTLLEGECAGLFRIERRTDPKNSKHNDASVYHLHDADFWRGEWVDPLLPAQTAAEAAEAVVAARVEAKRKAGIVPKGGRRKKAPKTGVASPVTPPQDSEGGVMGDATDGVTHDAILASPMTPNIKSPVENPSPEPSIPPSACALEIPETGGSDTDGRTDGGGVIEVQEQGAVQAGELETAAAVAAPELRSNGAGVAGQSSVAVAPVVMTPGVTVLRAIAAEAPEWKIVHAKTLEDQGSTVTEMLAVGFTPQEIRHAIVSVPLPQPVRTTIGAVIGGRLANLRATGPSAGILLIPAQHTGYDDVYGVRTEDTVHIPPSWREQQARLDADVAGQGRHRLCAGDDGMCGQLAVAGADLCGVCLGGEQPTCQSGCGRGVVAPGALCLVCRDAPSDVPEVSNTCPGLNDEPCGRPLQTMGTTGLCGRCTMKAEQIKMDAEAAWQTSLATAVEAASAPAPF